LLLHGPVLPVLVRLAVPNLLLILVQTSVGLIEMFWVARLGTDALAGVALVFPVVMLMQMMSGGAVGGGISASVARAIGGGRLHLTGLLAHHAIAISLGIGIISAAVVLSFGPSIYLSMGASGASLQAALSYSNTVFSGIVLLWLLNALASLLRGAGNITFPAAVVSIGAVVLAILSPVLIFGIGPFPRLGVKGAALAIVLYYAIGSLVLAVKLAAGRELVRLTWRGARFQWQLVHDILRVGAVSAIISTSFTLIVALTNAVIGQAGPTVIAGYGIGSRIEYLIVSFTFGLGVPVVAMVGTSVGAADYRRARRIAWTGAIIGGAVAEVIGLACAMRPAAWIGLFSHDPEVLSAGSQYLRMAGPAFGFIGVGMLLYFASQGAGRMLWPATAAVSRLAVVGATGLIIAAGGVTDIRMAYLAVAAAMVTFGAVNAWAMRTWPR
jgi:putative MATE family efflux protein